MEWPLVMERGLSAADPVEVGSYPMEMLVVRSHRCLCGGHLEPMGLPQLRSQGPRTLECLTGQCPGCARTREFWFDITRFHGDPDAAERFEQLSGLLHEGLTLARSGLMDRARPRLREVVAREPSFGMAWYHLGMVHLALDEHQPALRALQAAAAWCPLDVQVHEGLERTFQGMKRRDQADRHGRIAQTLRQVLADGLDAGDSVG